MELSEIQPGDVLFVWGDSLIDDAIEWMTDRPSHCALCVDSETLIEALEGRVTGPALLSDYLNTHGRLEICGDETLSDEERKKMVSFLKDITAFRMITWPFWWTWRGSNSISPSRVFTKERNESVLLLSMIAQRQSAETGQRFPMLLLLLTYCWEESYHGKEG